MGNSYLILFCAGGKYGSMVIKALNEDVMASLVDQELIKLVGTNQNYYYTFVDLEKNKALIYDMKPPTNQISVEELQELSKS